MRYRLVKFLLWLPRLWMDRDAYILWLIRQRDDAARRADLLRSASM